MADSMYAGFFAINVKPEHREAFIEASIAEGKGAIREEPGIFQFQIMVDESNPNRFYFFELFRDEAAAEEHWETEVFKTWWITVEPMFNGEVETLGSMRTIFGSTK